jgi:hypothetical protein
VSAALPILGPIIGAIIAATVGGIIAIRAIIAQRATARLRATLDTIERSETGAHYIKCSTTFRDFRRSGPNGPSDQVLDEVLKPQTPEQRQRRTEILMFLNHYELVAVGCETGVLDKAFYAQYMRGPLVINWRAARPLIDRMINENRHLNPRPVMIFNNLRALANEMEWEFRHEAYLRQQGWSERQIEESITYFRTHPKRDRPRR